MSGTTHDGEQFYKDCMERLYTAGHVFTLEPLFYNHSSEEFVYFDCAEAVSLTRDQRKLLQQFNNISKLITTNGCTFLSINLLCSRKHRSQVAHDIHTMLNPVIGTQGSIIFFRYDDELMLSFMGFGTTCRLSDWYDVDDPMDELADKLDIANMSLSSDSNYFDDFAYVLIRSYYQLPRVTSLSELLPLNFFAYLDEENFDREIVDQIIKERLREPETQYGDDYVPDDEELPQETNNDDLDSELDLMLLEMNETDDNLFGEEVEQDEDDGFFDDEEEMMQEEKDNYEFDDVDPEIFQDPAKMVKWIERHG